METAKDTEERKQALLRMQEILDEDCIRGSPESVECFDNGRVYLTGDASPPYWLRSSRRSEFSALWETWVKPMHASSMRLMNGPVTSMESFREARVTAGSSSPAEVPLVVFRACARICEDDLTDEVRKELAREAIRLAKQSAGNKERLDHIVALLEAALADKYVPPQPGIIMQPNPEFDRPTIEKILGRFLPTMTEARFESSMYPRTADRERLGSDLIRIRLVGVVKMPSPTDTGAHYCFYPAEDPPTLHVRRATFEQVKRELMASVEAKKVEKQAQTEADEGQEISSQVVDFILGRLPGSSKGQHKIIARPKNGSPISRADIGDAVIITGSIGAEHTSTYDYFVIAGDPGELHVRRVAYDSAVRLYEATKKAISEPTAVGAKISSAVLNELLNCKDRVAYVMDWQTDVHPSSMVGSKLGVDAVPIWVEDGASQMNQTTDHSIWHRNNMFWVRRSAYLDALKRHESSNEEAVAVSLAAAETNNEQEQQMATNIATRLKELLDEQEIEVDLDKIDRIEDGAYLFETDDDQPFTLKYEYREETTRLWNEYNRRMMMSTGTRGIKEVVKDDAIEVAYRTAAIQITKRCTSALARLAANGVKNKSKRQRAAFEEYFVAFCETDAGKVAVSALAWGVLSMASKVAGEYQPQIDRLGREFRLHGEVIVADNVTDAAVDLLGDLIGPIRELIQGLPKPSAAGALSEPTQEGDLLDFLRPVEVKEGARP